MMKITSNTQHNQYVLDSKPTEELYQAGIFGDVWEDESHSVGCFPCIARLCCLPFIYLKKCFYWICGSWCEKKSPSLSDIRKGIQEAHDALGDKEAYKKAFAKLPETLQQGFLITTMQMLAEGKLLRPGIEVPAIESEEALKKLAEEILANPLHVRFNIKSVFEDYLKKLK